MNENVFDELGKGFASGRVSRREALTAVLAGVGAAVLSKPLATLWPTAAWAATPDCAASCTTDILFEGTCQQFVNTLRTCCDANGLRRTRDTCPAGTGASDTSPDQVWCCKSGRYQPLFTCENTCANARTHPCRDSDLWLVLPRSIFSRARCYQQYTICANGKKVTAPVRDRSDANNHYEVSLGVLGALGLPTGSFKGKIYPPGTPQSTIDNDKCCNCSCPSGGTCGGPYGTCSSGSCICHQTSEGASCVNGATLCAGLPPCSSSAQCAAGSACFTNSCCQGGVCVPVCSSTQPAQAAVGAGPTLASR